VAASTVFAARPLHADQNSVVLLASGDACGEPALATRMGEALARHGRRPLPACVARSAAARARSTRALQHARELYVSTDFRGCASLLAIAERELSANLSGVTRSVTAQAHQLLAQVNLWLGVCYSLAGEQRRAAAAFQRCARLPSSPVPDSGELPPAVVKAYRKAVARSGPPHVCGDEVSGAGRTSLLVDGRVVRGVGPLKLREGGHYLAWGGCVGGAPGCRDRLPDGRACAGSVRISVDERGCRVTSGPRPTAAIFCLSAEEARDQAFAAEVLQQADAPLGVVAQSRAQHFTLNVSRRGSESFWRSVSGSAEQGQSIAQLLGRALAGALALGDTTTPMHTAHAATPFYRTWWFWGLVGGAVGSALTLTVVTVAR
jgi:hypothetical protein